jgi:hypothetical protein
LLSYLLSSDCEKLVFLLGFYKISANTTKFGFSLIDLFHVAAGFESAFLHKLSLIVTETSNFLLKILNLIIVLFVHGKLVGKIVL